MRKAENEQNVCLLTGDRNEQIPKEPGRAELAGKPTRVRDVGEGRGEEGGPDTEGQIYLRRTGPPGEE